MLKSTLRQTSRDLLDWLLPSQCLLCDAGTQRNPAHVPATLCGGCYDRLVPDEVPSCESCGALLGPHANPSGQCPHCRGSRFRFRSVTCLGMYDGDLRNLLLSGKWASSSSRIRTLARVYVQTRQDELRALRADRIIPIPQIWHRRLTRNFNPAALIAREVGRLLRIPVDLHVLRRSRGTRHQKRASFSDRSAIQRDSFRIRDAHVIRGERLLLTDDVLTTGATCNEAMRMLVQAGARECHVAVLGRVAGSV